MDKSTKYCKLTVHFLSGEVVTGNYHVAIRTSSTIRPSDALYEAKGGFIVLSDATINDSGGTRQVPTVMVRLDGVSYIEIPPTGWVPRPSG